MSYHGYIPLCKQYVHELPHTPSILEVGIDRGVTLLSLLIFLVRTRPKFVLLGIDVMVQEALALTVANIDMSQDQRAFLLQENSLTVLPQLVDKGLKFDIVLIDGDHNYHTVAGELAHLEALTHPHSLVIIDDYSGRWGQRDLWYAQRPEYEAVAGVTQPVDTEKHGVAAAVDEFLAQHPQWEASRPIEGEPIVLTRKE